MENKKNCGCGCSDGNSQQISGWAPVDAVITDNPDGSLTVDVSKDWTYIGFDDTYAYRNAGAAPSLTITCNCSGTGGCNPFYYNGFWGTFYGCEASGCSGSCSSKMSSVINSNPVTFTSGGFINLSITAQLLTEKDVLPAAFEAMLYSPEVLAIIKKFMANYYSGDPIPNFIVNKDSTDAPDGYSIVMVNICGRATPIILPTGSLPANRLSGSSSKCKCGSGTDGCVSKNKAGVSFCKAENCSSCSLSISSISTIVQIIVECFNY